MLVTGDVFQEQMLSEISGSTLLRVQSCNKFFFPPYDRLSTNRQQTADRSSLHIYLHC